MRLHTRIIIRIIPDTKEDEEKVSGCKLRSVRADGTRVRWVRGLEGDEGQEQSGGPRFRAPSAGIDRG